MDIQNINDLVSQPDVCRCCLSANGKWDLTTSYISESGTKEIYSEMLQECYGITLSHIKDWATSHMVCSLCVGQLRDACSFRNQVLSASNCFAEYYNKAKESLIKSEDNIDLLQPVSESFAEELLIPNDGKLMNSTYLYII
ncbi:unnamed protein product [Diatraea saccharalis]|uniref:ZAD domain-containing protein n=1 Tax=Diatraea saccharalis TaxID=40085 RepID=A0A9N9R5E3_9NEOP|nr:unnamed protein product [Diatraea saccharalis]